jgi:hypothetical protein
LAGIDIDRLKNLGAIEQVKDEPASDATAESEATGAKAATRELAADEAASAVPHGKHAKK